MYIYIYKVKKYSFSILSHTHSSSLGVGKDNRTADDQEVKINMHIKGKSELFVSQDFLKIHSWSRRLYNKWQT